jgi:hypothetical protein
LHSEIDWKSGNGKSGLKLQSDIQAKSSNTNKNNFLDSEACLNTKCWEYEGKMGISMPNILLIDKLICGDLKS